MEENANLFSVALDAESVFMRYNEMVYRLAFARTFSSFDSDDILSEVFLRYIRNKPDIKSEEHLKAWLIRVTSNCTNSHFSSSWKKKTVALEDNIAIYMKEKSEVYYAMSDLPEKYRIIVHLFYYEDMSVSEISSALSIGESAVKTRLFRARDMLKEKLKGGNYEI